jgi:hypothetical protein
MHSAKYIHDALSVGLTCLKNIMYLSHNKTHNKTPYFLIPYDPQHQAISIRDGAMSFHPFDISSSEETLLIAPTEGGFILSYLDKGMSWDLFQAHPTEENGLKIYPKPRYLGSSPLEVSH